MSTLPSSAPLPPPMAFDAQVFNSMGVSYIGLNIVLVLYGIISIQVVYYLRHWRSDPLYMPILVGILWGLITLHNAFFSHAIYYYLVSSYGDFFALLLLVWSVPSAILVSSIITTLVNTFFLWRLWKLTKNKLYLFVIVLFEVGHLSLYLLAVERIFTHKVMKAALAASEDLGICALVVDAVIGIMLSVCLIHHLRKNRTGYAKSDNMIAKLVYLTMGSGSLTTVFLIFEIIAWIIAPTHVYVSILNFLAANLNAISLLTFLNIRDGLRAGSESQPHPLPLSMRRRKDALKKRILPIKDAEEIDQFWISINDCGDARKTFITSLPRLSTFDISCADAV